MTEVYEEKPMEGTQESLAILAGTGAPRWARRPPIGSRAQREPMGIVAAVDISTALPAGDAKRIP